MSQLISTTKRQRFKFDAALFAVVRNEESFLALRRSGTGWMDGSWSLPAGAHDGNESFIVGALRELKEETGVLAKPEDCRFLHIQQVFTASSEWLAVYIGVDRFSGTPSIMESDKHDRVEWRDIAKAGAEPVVPYVLAALREISRKSNFSEFRA